MAKQWCPHPTPPLSLFSRPAPKMTTASWPTQAVEWVQKFALRKAVRRAHLVPGNDDWVAAWLGPVAVRQVGFKAFGHWPRSHLKPLPHPLQPDHGACSTSGTNEELRHDSARGSGRAVGGGGVTGRTWVRPAHTAQTIVMPEKLWSCRAGTILQ